MGTRLLVTIGSDGATDWVKTPDGQRFNLGSISVLSFVTKLVLGGSRAARRALDGFLRGEEVMLPVDEERMWELLAPRRSRWAAYPFIPQDQRDNRGRTMSTIDNDLTALEQHVQMLDKAASAGTATPEKMAEGVGILVKMASNVSDQSENDAYYGLGTDVHQTDEPTPEPDTVESVQAVQASEGVDKLAFDTYQANTQTATTILDQMEAVDQRIDQLVTAGKQFDSTRAKVDVHEVTHKVASIVSEVDLATTPWVADDLKKLAARADYLHGLFFPKGE